MKPKFKVGDKVIYKFFNPEAADDYTFITSVKILSAKQDEFFRNIYEIASDSGWLVFADKSLPYSELITGEEIERYIINTTKLTPQNSSC